MGHTGLDFYTIYSLLGYVTEMRDGTDVGLKVQTVIKLFLKVFLRSDFGHKRNPLSSYVYVYTNLDSNFLAKLVILNQLFAMQYDVAHGLWNKPSLLP